MGQGITLAPCGPWPSVQSVETETDKLRIVATSLDRAAACPLCVTRSTHIHSRYRRTLADLPSQGRRVVVSISARRFHCRVTDCRRQIFAERLEATVGAPFARRTARLEGIVHHLGLALGGRPGQSFSQRLLLPVSNDTVLRVVRRRAVLPPKEPRVVGIDDFAWKRGHRYGTIVCDLERRCIIDILPDREAATAAAWLVGHPSITVIARDRGAGYRQAIAEGRLDAVQVADRWHLMTTERDTFSKTVARTLALIGDAIPGLTVARDLLDRFHRIVENRKDDWFADAKTGLLASFASGIGQDYAAVKAALTEP
jgi:transposase